MGSIRRILCGRLPVKSEGGELSSRFLLIEVLLADVLSHLRKDGSEETVEFFCGAFGYELDSAVGKIADKACNFEVLGEAADSITKADSLNFSGIIDNVSLLAHKRYRVGGPFGGAAYRQALGEVNLVLGARHLRQEDR